ncbi:uncharacterized protein LOC132276819 [Cornus florida]|uniref:uncharacterized protein LOC132276819 n=1 Tax=Cornus florida TaxID=4283 RepID=UPI002897AE43|nr:uncharacterized protein LOC132276819 [Cornus florida]
MRTRRRVLIEKNATRSTSIRTQSIIRIRHSEDVDEGEEEERRTSNKGKSSKYDDHVKKAALSSEELHERDIRGKKNSDKDLKYKEPLPNDSRQSEDKYGTKRIYDKSKHEEYYSEGRKDSESARKGREDRRFSHASRYKSPDVAPQDESHKKRRNIPPKLSDEERALRLREMQMDAELHKEQRCKRLKKAEEDDAQEASRARVSSGRNFLDAAHKSVYGAEKGGSSTIEESVRRKFYSQGRSGAGDNNAFRR